MRENKNIFQYLSVCKTLILVGSNIFQAKTVTYLLTFVNFGKNWTVKKVYCIAIKSTKEIKLITNWLNTGNIGWVPK